MAAEPIATASPPILRYCGIDKSYLTSSTLALRSVDLTINEGEFLAIVGPSGCGKSTLLNLAAGIAQPTSGRVLYKGAEIRGPNTAVGYMTQHDTLLNWRTVHKNVRLPLEFRRIPRREVDQRVEEALALVGLRDFANRYPTQLSGGMRQRAAIARTLVYKPDIYLLDEPFGALDAQLRVVMQGELLQIRQKTGGTFILVTHDLNEAVTLADRVAVISSQPGTIKQVFEIKLPRVSGVVSLSTTPEFRGYVRDLWAVMDAPPASEQEG